MSKNMYLALGIMNFTAVIFSILGKSILFFIWNFLLLIVSIIGYMAKNYEEQINPKK